MSRFIGIVSSHNQVGKSTIALNLATQFSLHGRETALIDMDFDTAGINSKLGLHKLPITLHEVIAQNLHIKEAEYKHASGFSLIPAKPGKSGYKSKLMKKKIFEYAAGKELVIIDTETNLSNLANFAQSLIVVTNLNKESWNHTSYTIKCAESQGLEIIGLIINMVAGKVNVEQIEKNTHRSVLGLIPQDNKIQKSVDINHPAVYLYPNSKIAKSFSRIINTLESRGII